MQGLLLLWVNPANSWIPIHPYNFIIVNIQNIIIKFNLLCNFAVQNLI